jgi:hypothetical protein
MSIRRVTNPPSMSASEREGSPRLATPSRPAAYTSFQTITVDPPGFVIHQSESRAQMRSRTPWDSSRDVKYAGRYFRHDRGEKSTIAVCDVARDDDGHWQERFSA